MPISIDSAIKENPNENDLQGFIMKKITLLLLLLLLFLSVPTGSFAPPCYAAENSSPTSLGTKARIQNSNLDANGCLPRSTPEEQGISSDAIADTIKTLDQKINTMNSFMLVRHGKVIAECWWAPHSPTTLHAFYSLSKSYTSTAIGLAVAEGKLSLDDPVIKFFPDDLPKDLSENLKNMKVRHVLSMSGGHKTEPKVNWFHPALEYDEDVKANPQTWVKTFLAHPVVFKPGTHFQYNTCGTFMLSAILKKATGEDLFDYLKPRLFDPLQIKGVYWERNPQGISKGGTGFHAKTEDIAKFGQLYLQKGKWNGQQILSPEWVAEATSKHVDNGTNKKSDWAQGYGFQFWRCQHNVYRGDGAYVQYCVVMPDQDAVVAITSDSNQYQEELNILWDKLLPAFKNQALPANSAALSRLKTAQTGLNVKLGTSGSKIDADKKIVSKILGKTVNYTVYLPNNYVTDDFKYPVLYLLHGLWGNNNDWTDSKRGDLKAIADKYFNAHPNQKMIIVCPDAGNGWYVNREDGSSLYEDFFFNELIPDVEKKYRCKTDKKNRFIAGLSMGGYGSVVYALRHPELFAACCSMSPALLTDKEFSDMPDKLYKSEFQGVFGDSLKGSSRITSSWKKYSPHHLIGSYVSNNQNAVRFRIDCGKSDPLLSGTSVFHDKMTKLGIEHEFIVRPGVHDWKYWQTALPGALEFFK